MTAPLIASCERCGAVTTPEDGGVWARYADITAHRDAVAAWEARHPRRAGGKTLAELMSRPEPIRWHVGHWTCRTAEDLDAYAFDLPASCPAWLGWTAHLIGKEWVANSDLDELLREVARGIRRFAA